MKGKMIVKEQENTLLAAVKRIVTYHALLGIDEYPLSPAKVAATGQRLLGSIGSRSTQGIPPCPPDTGVTTAHRALRSPGSRSVQEAEPVVPSLQYRPDISSAEPQPLPGAALQSPHCVECPAFNEGVDGAMKSCKSGLLVVGLGLGPEEAVIDTDIEVSTMLFRMLAAIGLKKEDIRVVGLVPCQQAGQHPEKDAAPTFCLTALRNQCQACDAKVVLAFGPDAAHLLLSTPKALSSLRGRRHAFDGRPLIVTYHPAFLLKQQELKKAAWQDLLLLKGILHRKVVPGDAD